MADVDIDPFGEHESRTDDHTDTGENIPFTPVGGGSTWEPDQGEQETSFGGESQRTKLMKDYVRDLYKRLSENIVETPELFHYDYFKLEGGELYYRGSRKPLTTEGKLKSVGMLMDILGKNRLRRLGFNIPVGKLTARQAVMLNKAAEELPSESDITKADDIELQEIGGGGAISGGGEPPPKDEKGLKGWIRNKLKALASLLGKLGMKAADALPGIIGGIISWILNRAKDVVGWVSQNLWALVVGIGGLIYTYMVTRK